MKTAALNESLNLLSSIRKNAENMDENEDKRYSETMDIQWIDWICLEGQLRRTVGERT